MTNLKFLSYFIIKQRNCKIS